MPGLKVINCVYILGHEDCIDNWTKENTNELLQTRGCRGMWRPPLGLCLSMYTIVDGEQMKSVYPLLDYEGKHIHRVAEIPKLLQDDPYDFSP